MDASFYPPRDHFNNNSYDDNLKLQHEALKRIMNKYDFCSTNEELSTTMIDKIQDALIAEYAPNQKNFNERQKKNYNHNFIFIN
jgi:hypothetical protein